LTENLSCAFLTSCVNFSNGGRECSAAYSLVGDERSNYTNARHDIAQLLLGDAPDTILDQFPHYLSFFLSFLKPYETARSDGLDLRNATKVNPD
jgi:hypothetical protein